MAPIFVKRYGSGKKKEKNGSVLYGFKIDQSVGAANAITYIEDNKDYVPVYMDNSTTRFNYGSWKDAWFIKDIKPCMLRYDGTVDYELDPDDFSKRSDGTVSDYDNKEYEGNVMIGIPKVYWKITDNGDGTNNIYVSNVKMDEGFNCWSHIDANGNEIDYCYISAYDGYLLDGRIRSLSGFRPAVSMTLQNMVDYARANNVGDSDIWNVWVFADIMLINILLLLICKHTDTQTKFGYGLCSQTSLSFVGGTYNKGLFYGKNSYTYQVKVFGIENYWGHIRKYVSGWVNDNGVQKVKMTYGKQDGSTVDGYSIDGSGYITVDGSTMSGGSSKQLFRMLFTDRFMLPLATSSTVSGITYYDKVSYVNSGVRGVNAGGGMMDSNGSGAFAFSLSSIATTKSEYIGCALSCKPLKNDIDI